MRIGRKVTRGKGILGMIFMALNDFIIMVLGGRGEFWGLRVDKELQARPCAGPPASPFVAWRWDAGMGGAGGRARRHIHPRNPCPAGFPSGFSVACTPKIHCTLENWESGCSACSNAALHLGGGCVGCGVLHRQRGFALGLGYCTGHRGLHGVQGFAPPEGFCTRLRVLHCVWGMHQGQGFASGAGYCIGCGACTTCEVLHRVQGFAPRARYCTGPRVLHQAQGSAPGWC